MILTTHAIAGAAVASLNPAKPISGFIAGFAAHFILDAIPHWEYKIKSGFIHPEIGASFRLDRDFIIDVLRLGTDLTSGIIISLAIFYFYGSLPPVPILAGIIGGVLPDALQFVFTRIRRGPIVFLQRFHEWIHAPYKGLRQWPVLGATLQILLVAAIVLVVMVRTGF